MFGPKCAEAQTLNLWPCCVQCQAAVQQETVQSLPLFHFRGKFASCRLMKRFLLR